MILGQRLKLLTLIFMGIVFSAPTLACGGKGKYELFLKKKEQSNGQCVPLILEYPSVVSEFHQVELHLKYDNGKGRTLMFDLQAKDYNNQDTILTSEFCLPEDMLEHTSIEIEWFQNSQREDGVYEVAFCHVDVNTGDLQALLQSGGRKEIDPNEYTP